jgi:putative ABC transport system permease protein
MINKWPDGSYSTAIYGLDPFPFSRLNLIDGSMDADKLASGNYILEGVRADDNGNVETESFNHQVGDQITLKCGDSIRETTVLGHVIVNSDTNSDGSWIGSAVYLPADAFKEFTGVEYAMSYAFDVADDEESDMETFLKQYTDRVEPTMNYTSKFTALSSLEGVQRTAILVGGALALIIGLIGILNFINAVLTSILARRREFAMLQSIGMTRKQLKTVLCWEGGCYAILTAIVSVALSICCSLLIVRPFSANVWFMSFQFVFWPLAIILPILLVLSVLIPMIAYHSANRQSLVERLREAA